MKHGHTKTLGGRMVRSSVYMAWASMRQRCLDPGHRFYRHYGGRGITICPQWGDFAVFLRDVGPKPAPRLTFDRIDNNGNYEPGNVRWVSMSRQNRNRRCSKLTDDDVRFVRHWIGRGYRDAVIAQAFGVSRTTIWEIRSGRKWAEP